MRRPPAIAATLALSAVATGCSTMDEVKVSHGCNAPVTVILYHLEAGGTSPR